MSLFALGLGFCASKVVARGRLGPAAGTARKPEAVAAWRAAGVEAYRFDGETAEAGIAAALHGGRVLLVSIPPGPGGDPSLRALRAELAAAGLRRIVYLSTVGVYGDAAGGWVDEASPTPSLTARAAARVEAEAAWRALGDEARVAVDVLRLGGIYGPRRAAFEKLRDGTARRIVKPGQVFNRIHVDDVASAVETVVAAGQGGDVYNVVDGSPSAPEDVIAYAAATLAVEPPPEEPFETAGLTGMARSFYEENRRVRNERLRALGWAPRYQTYKEGLAAILGEEASPA